MRNQTISESFLKKYKIEVTDIPEKDLIEQKKMVSNMKSFIYMDYAKIIQRIETSKDELFGITSYFEVRANDDPALLEILSNSEFGFKCFSLKEVKKVREISKNSIIMGSPILSSNEMKELAQYNIDYFTVDSKIQVEKISEFCPTSKILIALFSEGRDKRFGVNLKQANILIKYALSLNIQPVGGQVNLETDEKFDCEYKAICGLKQIFKLNNIKFEMLLFNQEGLEFIDDLPQIPKYCISLNSYICSSYMTNCEVIQSVKVNEKSNEIFYYLSIGDLFLGKMYNQIPALAPSKILNERDDKKTYKCAFFGPTCDSSDCIITDHEFSKLSLNDFVVFENVGCFTRVYSGSNFNGFDDQYCCYRIFNKIDL